MGPKQGRGPTALTLRGRIFVVFAATILAVTATATAINVARGTSEVERETFVRQQEASRDTARAMRQLFDNGGLLLGAAAALLSADDFDPEPNRDRIASVLDTVLSTTYLFAGLHVMDQEGTVVMARPPGGTNARFQPATPPAHEGTMIVVGTESYPIFWCIQIPGTEDLQSGAGPYYLTGLMDLNEVEGVLFRGRTADAEAALVSGAQVIAATRPDFVAIDSGSASDPAPYAAAVTWTASEGNLVTSEEVANGAQVVLVGTGATAAVLRQRLIEDSILNGLVVAATGIVLGAWFAGQATRPLSRLKNATHAMAAGQLQTRVEPEGSAEFRGLAEDFNEMATNLQADRNALLALRGDLERRVEQRTEELRRQKEDMELFFYTVSHDIKNPAIAVQGYSDLINEELSRPTPDLTQVHRLIQRIERSGDNLEQLVREVLRFAHAERAAPIYTAFELSEVVQAVYGEIETQAREKGVRVTLHGSPLWVVSDRERIHHILANLVQNAVKYMPPGAGRRVAVAWAKGPAGRITLRVSDNGAGIPADVRPHLFRPFTRHVRETAGTEGTGLGLSIVHRMAASLGGSTRFETADGKGTTFWVQLPDGRPDTVEATQ